MYLGLHPIAPEKVANTTLPPSVRQCFLAQPSRNRFRGGTWNRWRRSLAKNIPVKSEFAIRLKNVPAPFLFILPILTSSIVIVPSWPYATSRA